MSWDLLVVGGGPGGYVSAIRAAQLGLKTALIERDAVGGTCLNRGCVPTKALLHSAGLYREMQDCDRFGIQVQGLGFDYAAMCARRDQVVDQLRAGVQSLLKGNGVEVISGTAVLEGSGRVRVGEELHEARNILLAVGSRPALPPIPGLDLPGVLTSDDLLTKADFYPRLAIIGGGVIGMEFASLYSALGAEVTVLEAAERILPTLDRELSQNLSMLLKKRGVKLCPGVAVERLEQTEEGLRCSYALKGKQEAVIADAVLVATGRRANTEELCAPGVDLGLERGAIPVDGRFQTRIPGVYAVGDAVAGSIQLAHAASAQGINAVSLLAGREPPMDLTAIPACVYTQPEMASVGRTEAWCKGEGIPVRTAKYLMSGNGRSLIAGADRGFIKVVSHAGTGVVLGAQLMCERATDLVGAFTTAVAERRTLEELSAIVRPHPTFSEGISEAAEAGLGLSIHQLNR